MIDRVPLLIIGAGHHAAVVRVCVDEGRFRVIGYLDDRLPIGAPVGDETVLGCLAELPAVAARHPGAAAVVAIGDNMTRLRVVELAERSAPGLVWAAIAHPSAIISRTAAIGPGCVIVAGAIVNCHTRLGRHVLINTGARVDHDNIFGDFASTGPGVSTGGDVHVGTFSHIGIGASVCHGIRIGNHCVIGGMAFVDRDVEDQLVCFGVPARPQRHRMRGAAYL
jgi:acetyltransferase EpsM